MMDDSSGDLIPIIEARIRLLEEELETLRTTVQKLRSLSSCNEQASARQREVRLKKGEAQARIVAYLTNHDRATAKGLSTELSIPLATVHNTLKGNQFEKDGKHFKLKRKGEKQ